MAFISTVPVDQATDDVRQMYESDQASLGYVANYTKVFSQHPQVMAGWTGLLRSIRGNMDQRRYELVTLAAARAMRSSYCMLAHGKILCNKFYSPLELAGIAEDFTEADLAPVDVAIMAYADKIVRDATLVRQEDIDGLRAYGLMDAEIFDIAAATTARCFFSKLLDALGAEPDSSYTQLEEDLRYHLVIGRPMSEQPVEQLTPTA